MITDNFVSLKASFLCRGRSRTAATSKMECFVIIVNGWKPLTIITKHSILDVAAVLDPPLLCYYKPHSPKIYFAYSAWISFRDPSFDFGTESIERFRFFYFIAY